MARVAVKSVASVVAKWVRRAGSAGEEYRAGVSETSADWAALSAAAAPVYATAVQESIGRGDYQKGIAKSGTAKWKANAVNLGPARYSQGVNNAEPAFTSGIGPVLAAIGAVDLPPRGPVGAEGNYARVAVVGKALRALKTGRR